ncbi:MAG: fibronectin type III-like domain-contianing protein [Bacteroidales bacterium]|nr:fibronectin type III-like domain-contianing protein [Bacteroidales bacterium]
MLTFKVTVKNTGDRAGKEAVLLYSSDLVASMVPDNRRLRAFDKISLEPGESKVVELSIPASDLAFVGQDGKWRLEAGDFRISVGNQYVLIKCSDTKVWNHQNID